MVSIRVKENKYNQMLNHTKFILTDRSQVRSDNFRLRHKLNTKLA